MSHIEKIMEKERAIRAGLSDPSVSELEIPASFFTIQIGLRPVMLDPIGRFWDVGSTPMKMIFDPMAGKR